MNLPDVDEGVLFLPVDDHHCIIKVKVDADRSQCQNIADESVPLGWVNFATESDDDATYFHYGPGAA